MTNIKDLSITKTVAGDSDYLVLQNPTTNETYKITRANFVAGFTSSGGSSSNDANFTNRLLLLKGNGSSSTDIVDSSSYNRTITRNGNPVISSAQSKFDGKSIYFDGSSYLTVANNSAFNLSTGDFAIQSFVFFTSVSGNQYIFDRYGGALTWQFGMSGAKMQFYIRNASNDGALINLLGTTTINTGVWHHFGARRVSGALSLWLNGLKEAEINANYALDSSLPLTIGRQGNSSSGFFSGYIDELRFSNRSEDLSIVPTAGFPTTA